MDHVDDVEGNRENARKESKGKGRRSFVEDMLEAR